MAILKIRDNNGNVTEIAALKGTGISKIEKTATNGLIDTYTITLTDGTTSTFTVTNGTSGSADIVIDTALSGTSTNPVQNKAITARVNQLQGDLNGFIAEVPDLIRQRTLCVSLDKQGEQTTHSVAQIYQHVQDGGQVVLLHPDYPDTYFALTEINESSAWFGGTVHDDNILLRFEYGYDRIEVYEMTVPDSSIDIRMQQDWDPELQANARTNIGLDTILTVDASNNYRGVNVTDMTFTPADTEREYPRNGDGVGIYLSEDTVDLGYDHLQAEKLEFYGLRSDEPVILSNIAPGQEDFDAATVGQVNEVAEAKANKSEGTFYIEGLGASDSTAKTSTWTGTSDRVTEYYDGLTIRYKIGVVGQSTVTLNINDLGAKTVYRFGTTKLTTQFPVGSIITLIYHTDLNDGCWVTNDYDANTNTQQRVYESSSKNVEYPLTARYNTTTGETYYAEYGRYSTGVTLNPSTKTITATTFKGKLTGNADTATKATKDANGNVIADTYETKANVATQINEVTQNFGPTISQLSTGLGSLADRVTELEGIDVSNAINTAVSAHNTNTSAHADIRAEISQLSSEIVDIKAESLQQVPLYANSIAECTDTSKMYVLPDGFIYAYLYSEATGPSYTNLSKTVHENQRMGSSGTLSALTGAVTTDFIPVRKGQTVRFKGFNPLVMPQSKYPYICYYTGASESNVLSSYLWDRLDWLSSRGHLTQDESGVYSYTAFISSPESNNSVSAQGNSQHRSADSITHIRMCGTMIDGETVIVTVDEEITEGTSGGYSWQNTGHAFVPADYEEEINKKANKIDIPTTLKNPYSLTINGTEYDGSKAVEVNIESSGNILYGKKWVACGDSFTHGGYNTSDGFDTSVYVYQDGKYAGQNIVYPFIIGLRNNMDIVNLATGGQTMAASSNSFMTRYTTIPADADYITIMLGINDKIQGIPVGTLEDGTNTTFCGAFNIAMEHILENHPFAHIGIMVSHGTNAEIMQATRGIAERWGVPYLDYGSPQVPLMNRYTGRNVCAKAQQIREKNFCVISDGTTPTNGHPNTAAHEYEATFIEAWLRTL